MKNFCLSSLISQLHKGGPLPGNNLTVRRSTFDRFITPLFMDTHSNYISASTLSRGVIHVLAATNVYTCPITAGELDFDKKVIFDGCTFRQINGDFLIHCKTSIVIRCSSLIGIKTQEFAVVGDSISVANVFLNDINAPTMFSAIGFSLDRSFFKTCSGVITSSVYAEYSNVTGCTTKSYLLSLSAASVFQYITASGNTGTVLNLGESIEKGVFISNTLTVGTVSESIAFFSCFFKNSPMTNEPTFGFEGNSFKIIVQDCIIDTKLTDKMRLYIENKNSQFGVENGIASSYFITNGFSCPINSNSPAPTPTPSHTFTPSETFTSSNTFTPKPTPTDTFTPSYTFTPSNTFTTPSMSPLPTATPTASFNVVLTVSIAAPLIVVIIIVIIVLYFCIRITKDKKSEPTLVYNSVFDPNRRSDSTSSVGRWMAFDTSDEDDLSDLQTSSDFFRSDHQDSF